MVTKSVIRYRAGVIAVLLLVLLLLAALHVMSDAVQHSDDLGRWYMPLLLFTSFGLTMLLVLIFSNLVRLVRQYRSGEAGARLTRRLVLLFVLLSLAPVSVVYYYSMGFLLRGIDSWFDVQVDTAMEDSLDLSRAALDLHKRSLLKLTRQALGSVENTSGPQLAVNLGNLRQQLDAGELALVDGTGKVIAASFATPGTLVPEKIPEEVLAQVRGGKDYAGLVLGTDGISQLRVVVRDPGGRPVVLQVMYPLPENMSALTSKVQSAYVVYKERAYLKNSIKFSFVLTLSLVLMASLLAAVWAAFLTARRLVRPIRDIAAGTKSVADGDYGTQLPVPRTQDELGFLVSSFNAMTRRIALARDAAERSQRQLETQHTYLETVLGSLRTGVVAVDTSGSLRRSNSAASAILRLDVAALLGQSIEALSENQDELETLVEVLRQHIGSDKQSEWQGEIELYRTEGRQVLLCRTSELVVDAGGALGTVLVFDDVTELVKAQRDAAWGEVARRLAHEIKNPLTPIQLSAERMRRKYMPLLEEGQGEVLDKATRTIVQQVEALKSMVQDFSDYARPSRPSAEPVLIDALLADVFELYRGSGHRASLDLDLAAPQALIQADPVRLRQVFHNLIKNAQEATGEVDAPRVGVSTRVVVRDDCEYVELKVQDNGPGFDDEVRGQVFEPYVTTKSKGTGLGLAIVKKIIDEHGGMIRIENAPNGGGLVQLQLPLCEGRGLTGQVNRRQAG